MNRAFAVEIKLARALTDAEADAVHARVVGRYAFSCDLLRAITVLAADTVTSAVGRAWDQAGDDGLPLDVAWSVHPDADGRVVLHWELDTGVEERLRRRADAVGLSLAVLVEEALAAALEQETRRRFAAARTEVVPLLLRHSLENLLRALAATAPQGFGRQADGGSQATG